MTNSTKRTIIIDRVVFSPKQLELIKELLEICNIGYDFLKSNKVYSDKEHILLTKSTLYTSNACGSIPYLNCIPVRANIFQTDDTYFFKREWDYEIHYRIDASKSLRPFLEKLHKHLSDIYPEYQVMRLAKLG